MHACAASSGTQLNVAIISTLKMMASKMKISNWLLRPAELRPVRLLRSLLRRALDGVDPILLLGRQEGRAALLVLDLVEVVDDHAHHQVVDEERAHEDPHDEEERRDGRRIAPRGLVDGVGVHAVVHDVGPHLEARHLEERQDGAEDVVEVAELGVDPHALERVARVGVDKVAHALGAQRDGGVGADGHLAREELLAEDAEDEHEEQLD
eukprot:scaffold37895_cov79-Phaeocystis_antarctica.AAC.2